MNTDNVSTIAPYVLQIVIVVGIIVLMALGTVAATAGLPVLALFAGFHIGGNTPAVKAALKK